MSDQATDLVPKTTPANLESEPDLLDPEEIEDMMCMICLEKMIKDEVIVKTHCGSTRTEALKDLSDRRFQSAL